MTPDLAAAHAWVLDLDGSLVRTAAPGGAGGRPFAGAVELVAKLKAAGRRVLVCSNASARAPARYAADLRALGFDLADHELVTAGIAAAEHVSVAHPGRGVIAVGGEGLTVPLRAAGVAVLDRADAAAAGAVVVGGADSYATADLTAACLAVEAGAGFYVTVQTPWFHGGLGRAVSGSSAVAAAIASVTGGHPVSVGKPSEALAERLLARLGDAGAELVVAGDHVHDLQLARRMGAIAVLLLSGATSTGQLDALPVQDRPDLAFADIGAVHDLVVPYLHPTIGAHPTGAQP